MFRKFVFFCQFFSFLWDLVIILFVYIGLHSRAKWKPIVFEQYRESVSEWARKREREEKRTVCEILPSEIVATACSSALTHPNLHNKQKKNHEAIFSRRWPPIRRFLKCDAHALAHARTHDWKRDICFCFRLVFSCAHAHVSMRWKKTNRSISWRNFQIDLNWHRKWKADTAAQRNERNKTNITLLWIVRYIRTLGLLSKRLLLICFCSNPVAPLSVICICIQRYSIGSTDLCQFRDAIVERPMSARNRFKWQIQAAA